MSNSGAPDEIAIEFTGLRAGEKLFEELLADADATVATAVPRLRVAQLAAHAQNVGVLLASQQAQPWSSHYVHTKDGAEVDFCLSETQALTHLVECKLADAQPYRALVRFAAQFPQADAVQLVRDLRHNPRLGASSRSSRWPTGWRGCWCDVGRV